MTITLDELPEAVRESIRTRRFDRLVGKHEGPFDWASELRWSSPEFLDIEGRAVLLPIDRSHHANVSVLRVVPSADARSMTLFIKDTTYVEPGQEEWHAGGFLAFVERFLDEPFYLATVYHEWFVLERAPEG